MKTLSLALCVLSLGPAARADVVIKTAHKNGGFHGIGASSGETTRSVSGVKARDERDKRADILRVDLDKRWALDLKKKTYVEGPIKFEMPAEGEGGGKDAAPGKEQKPTHRVKSAKAEVKKSGEAKTINGFKTEKWAATLTLVIEEIATKQTAEYAMTTDIWATPWTKELRQAMEEEAKFAKAYLKKLGLELSPEERGRFGADGARAFLRAGGPEVESAIRKMGKELSSLEGYPIVTETTWRSPAPAAPKGQPAAPEEDEDDGNALSDASGASSVGGAAMGVLGGFAKRAAKKKIKAKIKEALGKPAFSVRTEVKSVTVGPVAAETFEIPEGFKKKD